MVNPVIVDSIESLYTEFDLFLFDQYGVLHDGHVTYPGMVDCLASLKSQGKAVAVISNSGKRAAYNAGRLARFGFGRNLVDEVVSSGEVAWSFLARELAANPGKVGKVLYLGRGDDRSAIDGLPLVETDRPAEADVLMITGNDPDRYTLEDYATRIEGLARRKVPAYCTNPDRWSLSGNGRQYGPGQVAELYEQNGGEVTWIGKPHDAIYKHVLGLFDLPAERVLCIGDSIEHDIRGAASAGCRSLLVSTGIHEGLGISQLAPYYERYNATPSYLIQRAPHDEPASGN